MPVRRRALTAKLSLLFATMAAVCLGQRFPPPSDSDQYAAKVLTMSGQVSVLKDTILYGLVDGSTVKVQEMIVTGVDGHATFRVSDGSTFEVFPNSHLVFRKNAWNVTDLIDLLVGRIRVHIEHLGNVPNPNRVLTPTAVISVRGTTFDVSVDDNDETTTVEVEDGLVEVRHALLPSNGPKMLGPGDSLKVYRSVPIAQNRWDKGTVAHFIFKMAQDAANVATLRINRGVLGTGGGSSAGSSAGSGDSGKPTPPSLSGGGLPPLPGHYADSGAQPARPAQHGAGATIRVAAKKTVLWLGKVTGVTELVTPVIKPIELF